MKYAPGRIAPPDVIGPTVSPQHHIQSPNLVNSWSWTNGSSLDLQVHFFCLFIRAIWLAITTVKWFRVRVNPYNASRYGYHTIETWDGEFSITDFFTFANHQTTSSWPYTRTATSQELFCLGASNGSLALIRGSRENWIEAERTLLTKDHIPAKVKVIHRRQISG